MNRDELAGLIDHTLLKPEATPQQIERLCAEARDHHFASVCVNPVYVKQAAEALSGSGVAVCSVVGFPLGANTTEAKGCEALQALADGAEELDMVINIGMLKAGEDARVQSEIMTLAHFCHEAGALLKVIIETALLSDGEKVIACRAAQAADAEFVKTSTGFASGGATVEDVRLMRETVGPEMGVKAAGGIHSYAEAMQMIEAGATRIGASGSLQILEGAPA